MCQWMGGGAFEERDLIYDFGSAGTGKLETGLNRTFTVCLNIANESNL